MEELYDEIEDYLDEKLKGKSLERFEKKLANNEDLKNEIQLHRNLKNVFSSEDIRQLKKDINSVIVKNKKEYPDKKLLGYKKTIYNYSIAATVLFLIICGLVIFHHLKDNRLSEIVRQNIEYPAELIDSHGLEKIKGSSSFAPDKHNEILEYWQEANQLYKNKQYEQARDRLNKVPAIDNSFPLFPEETYYYSLGVLHLKNNETIKAYLNFIKVKKGIYYNEAIWLQAMCLLSIDGKEEDAVKLLTELSNSNHPKKGTAINILEDLK